MLPGDSQPSAHADENTCHIYRKEVHYKMNNMKKYNGIHAKMHKKRTVKRLSEWASITQLTREPHNPLGIFSL